jgi:hypothetical protein
MAAIPNGIKVDETCRATKTRTQLVRDVNLVLSSL